MLEKRDGEREWGYPTKTKCQVCGSRDNVQSEPRFDYDVCEGHQWVSPVMMNDYPKPFKGESNV